MKNKKIINNDTKYILLEQYRIAVDMADKLNTRKESASKLFVSANAIFFAFLASRELTIEMSVFLSLFGIFLSVIWSSLMKNHNVVHSAKYEVIEEMEEHLPYKVFDSEWKKLGKGLNKKRYRNLGTIEHQIPLLFIILYLILFIFNAINYLK